MVHLVTSGNLSRDLRHEREYDIRKSDLIDSLMRNKWLTAEVAKEFGCSAVTINARIKKFKIPYPFDEKLPHIRQSLLDGVVNCLNNGITAKSKIIRHVDCSESLLTKYLDIINNGSRYVDLESFTEKQYVATPKAS